MSNLFNEIMKAASRAQYSLDSEKVKFKTRREAREYAFSVGGNTASVIDAGKDKAVGERWLVAKEIVKSDVVPAVPQKPRQLVLKQRNVEVLSTVRSSRSQIHSVEVVTKRKFRG
ncbi:hypothetical protein POP12_241 [Pectobacterium phage POP12]|nr:hypothetical protein POP12_241 [Pectobacterium phage POP12]